MSRKTEKEVAWVNGRLVGIAEPAVAVTDPGFLYGEGLFETMRAYDGKVFRLRPHLERLRAGAAEVPLAAPPLEALETAVAQALVASDLRNASVRVTVTPGVAAQPTVVVLVRNLSLPPRDRYESGCYAVTVPAALVQGTSLRRVKSLNYLDKLLAQRLARQAGAHEAILIDPDGGVVEAAMRNVFAVVGGALVTPPLSRGLLPGITRGAILAVASRLGLSAAERDLPLPELRAAEECFLTSSLAEVLPVASVDGHPLLAPGPVTRALTQGYRELVAEELDCPKRSG